MMLRMENPSTMEAKSGRRRRVIMGGVGVGGVNSY
jgi:hypothetical protein